MKIRRALTAAAAAAALAPATVLTAPAAFAAPQASDTAARTPAAGNAGDSDGADRSCAFESDQLKVTVKGLPRELAAGGDWTPFSMTLANTTDKPLDQVLPFLTVSSAEDVDRPYWELETEYHDAETGKWKTFHDASPDDLFGYFALAPHRTRTLELRTHAVKTAKPGAGYALAAGDFRNGDGSCGSAKEAWSDFTILPVGAKPARSATGEPGHRAPSALPLTLAGSAAVAVGAGAAIGIRRRRSAAGPDATDTAA
ncbi:MULTISPECIES: hypothetical protein [Streptomyces]|uniref:Cell wall protein n=1 Tax=Streptomyces ramulosus TaxID=47762 RepID=A0ABW1FPP0_9ACTN